MSKDVIEYIKEKWNIILYFIFLVAVLIVVAVVANQKDDVFFHKGETIEMSQGWIYQYGDGTNGETSLPADLPYSDSRYLYLTNTLPDTILDNDYFIFRVRHTFVRITIDGKCVEDRISGVDENKWYTLEGIHYVEVKLSPQDAGKEIVIESFCSEPKYLCSPGFVYVGERGTLFLNLIQDRLPTFICFIVLMLTAVVLFSLWLCAIFVTRENSKEILCLALFTVTVGFWILTETQMAQILGFGSRALTLLAYEDLALIPVPIALFFCYASEREKSKNYSKIAAIIPIVVFFVNNMLHMLHILSLVRTLMFTQFMLGVEVAFIAYIQITELNYIHKNSKQYSDKMGKIPMIGIIMLVPLSSIEILKYAFSSTKYANDGILISIGVTTYIVCLGLDSVLRITYRKATMEQTVEVKTQFLANMSHEIRTPLNAMLGFTDAILLDTNDSEKVASYAHSIHEAGENLKAIINDILDVSKIEMGQLQIESKEYSLLQLLDNVSSMFEMLAKNKDLDFFTRIDTNVPKILIGDEQHLRQVLTNILSNAVKYTDKGAITLTVKVIGTEGPLVKLYFEIRDTGRGIKVEDRDRLFSKFERLDTEHFKHVEGTGLGMNIVLHTLRAMGSEIQFNSEYGKGTTFYFELPQVALSEDAIGDFAEKRKENALKEVKSHTFRAPKAKVLIVDDVDMNIEAAKALLGFTQMHIDKATSGRAAIEAVRFTKYDIIFMDHMMPEMDGIETTEKIRELAVITNDAYFAMVPIIALTANAIVGMREMYQDVGMQDFVSKPIELRTMVSVLKKWLPKELIQEVGQEGEGNENDDNWNIVIPGIEIAEAQKYNADVNGLEMNMKSFANAYPANSNEIDSLFFSNDISNYVIKVHGLKSTSKMIGAMELSEHARLQEEAGKNGVMSVEEHMALMDIYGACVEQLINYWGLNEQAESDSISDEEYRQLLQRIKNATDIFSAADYMLLEEQMQNLSVPDEHAIEFEKLKGWVSMLSFGDVSDYFSGGNIN